ncbi:NAD(P)-dependent oxidoreductase [Acetobacteraceae bacterium KSS12]|uniref:NAD(P)-dependent oxidoreductase n=2 Tax=Rhizosaccharibacter radicis TaxID=2782605 RepID=A0ABT1VV68_9PROT|nr:NAD(P)-dependent oxidoreductase [Acetobacteraceae bacterium KSS12]
MGRAIAANLVKADFEVKGWNRSGVDVDGVLPVDSPAEALDADITLTMLSDDAAIRETLLDPGILSAARPGLIHVAMSTISVAFAHELVLAHQHAGVRYLSAPVLGRPDVAAKGELNILAGGDAKAIEAARPVFEAIGKRVWPMGETAPAANAAKIACNMMIMMAIEAMAEAVTLTEANGIARDAFFDLILNTLFGSRSYQVYSANIAQRSYEPGFKASLGLKDLRLASEAAAGLGRTLPMLQAVHAQMGAAVDAGMGGRDWSSIAAYTLGD